MTLYKPPERRSKLISLSRPSDSYFALVIEKRAFIKIYNNFIFKSHKTTSTVFVDWNLFVFDQCELFRTKRKPNHLSGCISGKVMNCSDRSWWFRLSFPVTCPYVEEYLPICRGYLPISRGNYALNEFWKDTKFDRSDRSWMITVLASLRSVCRRFILFWFKSNRYKTQFVYISLS